MVHFFKRRKRKKVQKLKKDGVLSAENFGKLRLEELGLELFAFKESLTSDPDRVLSDQEIWMLVDIERVIDTVSLILSENTDYGYIEELNQKFSKSNL